MADATEALACHLENDVVHINDPATRTLEITFHRTIRVPDNDRSSNLPPDMGRMSLFKVSEYAGRLPAEMAVKGGLFTPIYQSEAMWIRFSSEESFAIKLYVGGVNAISGEPAVETAATNLRRQNLIAQSKSVQNYLVTPLQDWLDGFATADGIVRQFVAMPMGSGFTVEQQVTGEEVTGGLQFEVTPLVTARIYIETWQGERKVYFVKPDETVQAVKMVYQSDLGFSWKEMELICEGQLLGNTLKMMSASVKKGSVFQLCLNLTTFDLNVKTWTGRLVRFAKIPDSVEDLKLEIRDREGIPPEEQRLAYNGSQLEGISPLSHASRDTVNTDCDILDGKRLSEYGVTSECTIYMGSRIRGGIEDQSEKSSREMGLAAGGLIRQVIMRDVLPANHWDASRTLVFNVQILNASHFQQITGIPPPQRPISASTYHELGLPFYSKWEEPTTIFGNFQGIKSVAQLNSTAEPTLKFMVINLDEGGHISKRVGELSELDQTGLLELDAAPVTSELEECPTRDLPLRPLKFKSKVSHVSVRGMNEIDGDSSEGRNTSEKSSRRWRGKSRLPAMKKWIERKRKKEDSAGPIPVYLQFGKGKPIQIGLVNPRGPLSEFRSVKELEDEIRKKTVAVF